MLVRVAECGGAYVWCGADFLIPKMRLATSVLHKGMVDLFFFGLVFGITMLAFCMMFYVQVPTTGPKS